MNSSNPERAKIISNVYVSEAIAPDTLLVISGSPRRDETLEEFAKRCCCVITNVSTREVTNGK